MAITKTWEVNTLERELADGYVKKVIYRVKGIDGSRRKDKSNWSSRYLKSQKLLYLIKI